MRVPGEETTITAAGDEQSSVLHFILFLGIGTYHTISRTLIMVHIRIPLPEMENWYLRLLGFFLC